MSLIMAPVLLLNYVNVFLNAYRVMGTKAMGTGLGLGIVRQIALHHAKIELNTPRSGKGLQVFDLFKIL